jgi:hypothetical protein
MADYEDETPAPAAPAAPALPQSGGSYRINDDGSLTRVQTTQEGAPKVATYPDSKE